MANDDTPGRLQGLGHGVNTAFRHTLRELDGSRPPLLEPYYHQYLVPIAEPEPANGISLAGGVDSWYEFCGVHLKGWLVGVCPLGTGAFLAAVRGVALRQGFGASIYFLAAQAAK